LFNCYSFFYFFLVCSHTRDIYSPPFIPRTQVNSDNVGDVLGKVAKDLRYTAENAKLMHQEMSEDIAAELEDLEHKKPTPRKWVPFLPAPLLVSSLVPFFSSFSLTSLHLTPNHRPRAAAKPKPALKAVAAHKARAPLPKLPNDPADEQNQEQQNQEQQ
jgi:hypothetical protein